MIFNLLQKAKELFYDNTTSGLEAENVQDAIDELKNSVSNGKTLVANAITGKGQQTATDATFQTMANNIGNLKPSDYIKPSGTLTLSNATSGTDCTNYATVKTDGLVKPSGTKSITSNGTVDVSSYASASVSVSNSVAKNSQSPANGNSQAFDNGAGGTSNYGHGTVIMGNVTVSKSGNTVTVTIPETVRCYYRTDSSQYKDTSRSITVKLTLS